MFPSDPLKFMTKVTAIAPGGECKMWMSFLDQVTMGDKELQKFLQRMAGYCLTGCTREHALFFFFGSGGNGKGVFLNTISKILGPYAGVASLDVLISQKTAQHSTDLAGLRGSRLVTAQEVDEEQSWAEAKLKAITGGDKISARKMRQDFFEFAPQFKLLLAGNHKPHFKTVDRAIKRRLHLIEFKFNVPAEQCDKTLDEKLWAEAPGILQWMIEGCLEWQRIELSPPACVLDATQDYFEDEDIFSQWISICCVTDPNENTASRPLYESWGRFAKSANVAVGDTRAFTDRMRARGFSPVRRNKGSIYVGIALRQSIDFDAKEDVA